MDRMILQGEPCISGKAEGEAVFSYDSFSFLGGVDLHTGEISDYRHSCCKKNIANNIFVFPFVKGSTVAGPILSEMIRLGTAPAGIINLRTDPLLMTGPLIFKHFYGKTVPIVNVSEEDYKRIEGAVKITIREDNTIEVYK